MSSIASFFKFRKAILSPCSQCHAYLKFHYVITTGQSGAALRTDLELKLDCKRLLLEEAHVWGVRSLTSSSETVFGGASEGLSVKGIFSWLPSRKE